MTNYTILQNDDIIANISDGAFRLYTFLNSMCYGDKNTCFPSQFYLAEKLCKSVRTIQRYLIELVQAGYIKIKRRGSISNVYKIVNKVTSTVKEAINKAKNAYNRNFKKKKDNDDIKKTKFNDYEQRNYDYNNLEQMLLGNMEYNPDMLLE
jgi:DNA-binding transcriptional regulator YhcF (GntR family)